MNTDFKKIIYCRVLNIHKINVNGNNRICAQAEMGK